MYLDAPAPVATAIRDVVQAVACLAPLINR
jgi:hypothetical protein